MACELGAHCSHRSRRLLGAPGHGAGKNKSEHLRHRRMNSSHTRPAMAFPTSVVTRTTRSHSLGLPPPIAIPHHPTPRYSIGRHLPSASTLSSGHFPNPPTIPAPLRRLLLPLLACSSSSQLGVWVIVEEIEHSGSPPLAEAAAATLSRRSGSNGAVDVLCSAGVPRRDGSGLPFRSRGRAPCPQAASGKEQCQASAEVVGVRVGVAVGARGGVLLAASPHAAAGHHQLPRPHEEPVREGAPAARRRAPLRRHLPRLQDRRPPRLQPRRRRAHRRPALRLQRPPGPHPLGRRPPVVPAQDPDGAAGQDADDAADQRAGGVHQALRERVRQLRHGAQLHDHLGGAGHGRGAGPQGLQEQRHRGDRRRRHDGGAGVRGHEQRRVPRLRHDRHPQRQQAGVPADGDARRAGAARRRAQQRPQQAAVQPPAQGAQGGGQGRDEADRRVGARAGGQGGRVRPRHDQRARLHALRGARPLLHRPRRRPQHRRPHFHPQRRQEHQDHRPRPHPRRHREGPRLPLRRTRRRQVPRRRQVRPGDGEAVQVPGEDAVLHQLLRRGAHRRGRGGQQDRGYPCGHGRRHGAQLLPPPLPQPLLRRRDRRAACRHVRRRPGLRGPQALLRHLLLLPAARLRPGGARRGPSEAPGEVRHGQGRAGRRGRAHPLRRVRRHVHGVPAQHGGHGSLRRGRALPHGRHRRRHRRPPLLLPVPERQRHRRPAAAQLQRHSPRGGQGQDPDGGRPGGAAGVRVGGAVLPGGGVAGGAPRPQGHRRRREVLQAAGPRPHQEPRQVPRGAHHRGGRLHRRVRLARRPVHGTRRPSRWQAQVAAAGASGQVHRPRISGRSAGRGRADAVAHRRDGVQCAGAEQGGPCYHGSAERVGSQAHIGSVHLFSR